MADNVISEIEGGDAVESQYKCSYTSDKKIPVRLCGLMA